MFRIKSAEKVLILCHEIYKKEEVSAILDSKKAAMQYRWY